MEQLVVRFLGAEDLATLRAVDAATGRALADAKLWRRCVEAELPQLASGALGDELFESSRGRRALLRCISELKLCTLAPVRLGCAEDAEYLATVVSRARRAASGHLERGGQAARVFVGTFELGVGNTGAAATTFPLDRFEAAPRLGTEGRMKLRLGCGGKSLLLQAAYYAKPAASTTPESNVHTAATEIAEASSHTTSTTPASPSPSPAEAPCVPESVGQRRPQQNAQPQKAVRMELGPDSAGFSANVSSGSRHLSLAFRGAPLRLDGRLRRAGGGFCDAKLPQTGSQVPLIVCLMDGEPQGRSSALADTLNLDLVRTRAPPRGLLGASF
eukprot:TRINITY_DN74495_c0_g1_i1.p1 TRINITY_DN74495_c0_g1~~TRINITY_DN74495_c0_g1_i1.p1  ORF type:complete len:362 (+),score=74.48 TRINITY_DN74495_c0_g1_i1:99-1088(+)